ncbi:MAG: hypothetical protein K2K75_04725 [Muribaculaceae bacterium]|nr:hypothetical protein [Muribaculaceae bacterium]
MGDDWETGEYRMYVNTSGSLGAGDTLMTPKRLLIVRELPEAQEYVSGKGNAFIKSADSIEYGKISPLNVTIELDSAEYHVRSRVRARVKVTDSDGNPVRAGLALSVHDRLYFYAPGDLDVLSHCLGVREFGAAPGLQSNEAVLPDGPVTGTMMSGKKKSRVPMENQFMTAFDYTGSMDNLNVVTTGTGGRFEVPVDILATLGREILLKPVSGKDMKPVLEIDDNFAAIEGIRSKAKDKYYPVVRTGVSEETADDTLDYMGRRVVRLDEVEVKGKAGRYPKRNKMLGYLDSISTPYGGAWVCGCGDGSTYLNDYIQGYTHHPDFAIGDEPQERKRPIKGKRYTLIKYLPGGKYGNGYVDDIQKIVYNGPQYTEDELLKMNGLTKANGYYPGHDFEVPDEVGMSLGLEDNRNTLLWLPQATTDENGEMEFEFYTSDISSLFSIVCLAYEKDGKGIGESNKSFKVFPI